MILDEDAILTRHERGSNVLEYRMSYENPLNQSTDAYDIACVRWWSVVCSSKQAIR